MRKRNKSIIDHLYKKLFMRWTNCRISLVAPVTAFLFPHLFFFNNDMKRNPLYDIISCFNMDVSTFQKALNSYRIPSTVIGSFLNWNWNVLDPICWLICPECCKFQFNLNEMGNKVTAFQSSSSENCQLKFKLPFAYQQQRNVYGWSVTNKSRAMKLNIWQFNRSWKQIYSKWQKKKIYLQEWQRTVILYAAGSSKLIIYSLC